MLVWLLYFNANGTTQINQWKEDLLEILNSKPRKDPIIYSDNITYKSLDTSNILWGKDDIKFLKDWLEAFSYIKSNFETREHFNSRKWEILTSDSVNNWELSFDLYMPEDLSIWDLPGIIKKVNDLTYGMELPSNASFLEIETQLKDIIKYLLSIKNEKNEKELKKTISKYYSLYNY